MIKIVGTMRGEKSWRTLSTHATRVPYHSTSRLVIDGEPGPAGMSIKLHEPHTNGRRSTCSLSSVPSVSAAHHIALLENREEDTVPIVLGGRIEEYNSRFVVAC